MRELKYDGVLFEDVLINHSVLSDMNLWQIETRKVRAWRVYCSNGGTVRGIHFSGYAWFTIHSNIEYIPNHL